MTQDRVMLLIDADNVSLDIMEQALHLLHKQHGGVHVRRAYCTAESAVKHQGAFKRLGIKPMVNLAAGKNSTDIALAVDAMDLVLAERPEVVVIASSDSDFAPLVQRLREKGCEVRGIGQLGKTGQETQDVYDDFTVLEHRKPADAMAVKRPPARKAVAAKKTAVASKVPAAKKTLVAKKAARKSAARPPAAPMPAVDATLEAQAAAAFADAVASDEVDTVEAAPPPKPARKRAARKSVDERVAASAASAASAALAGDAAAAAAPAEPETATKAAPEKAPEAAPEAAPETAPRTPPKASPKATPEPAPKPPAPAKPSATATATATADKPARTGSGRTSLDAVLQCLPELQSGQSLALNTAVRRLRDAQLLGQNSSSLKLFSSWPERFELVPANRPSVVRLRG